MKIIRVNRKTYREWMILFDPLFISIVNQYGTYISEEESVYVKCKYTECVAGMGLANRGACHRSGNPFDKFCSKWVKGCGADIDDIIYANYILQ